MSILLIPPALMGTIIIFFVKWVILTVVFYITGRIIAGINAKFTDAIIVAFVGSLLSAILHWAFEVGLPMLGLPFAPETINLISLVGAALITIIVYLPLFMHFFDVGFGGAMVIGILCLIIYVLIEIPVLLYFPTLVDYTPF